MSTELKNYVKKKEYLICVDSDGCAMDTMDIKHHQCFGPCMVEEWALDKWREPVLERWNEINLYSATRGINRFKGLAIALREIDSTYLHIEDIDVLERWVEETNELSNSALEKAIGTKDSIVLKKALSWSKSVNERINALPFEVKKPFPCTREGLAYAHEFADIAIVSSANLQAVKEEWELHGILDSVDILLAQNAGSKAYCIGEMLKKGYEKEKVLMIGDASGDCDAAMKNDVFYYPILVRREKQSWKEFQKLALKKFVEGSYAGEYQQKKYQEFWDNLSSGRSNYVV